MHLDDPITKMQGFIVGKFGVYPAEVALIQRAMAQTDGNITEAAKLLGINRTKIYRKLAQADAVGE